MHNRVHLKDIRTMPVGDIAALPVEQLTLLQEEAEAAFKDAKTVRDWVDGAIALRFGEQAQTARQRAGKDSGAVRLTENGVIIVADLPKRVDGDQGKLAAVVQRIQATGDNSAEYVDTVFKVPEHKYNAWPNAIQSVFKDARTVRVGKPNFKLTLANGEGAQ